MLVEKAQILDEKAMARAVTRIAFEILERNKGTQNICIIGIMSRGMEIANRIAKKITEVEGVDIPIGYIDITQFRDDKVAKEDYVNKSDIPFGIADKKVILVDDVIFTGRSVRAAIDAIMSQGRPLNIQLAALIDRGHRELPIRADFIGKNLPTSLGEVVKVQVKERDGVDRVSIFGEERPQEDEWANL